MALAARHLISSDIISVALVSAAQAVLAHHAGDRTRALKLAEQAIQIVDRGDQTWNRADIRRWLAPVASAERSRQLLNEAYDLYAEKGLLLWHDDVEGQLPRP